MQISSLQEWEIAAEVEKTIAARFDSKSARLHHKRHPAHKLSFRP